MRASFLFLVATKQPPGPGQGLAAARLGLRARLGSPWTRLALGYFTYFGLMGCLQPFTAAALAEHHFAAAHIGATLSLLTVLSGAVPMLAHALLRRLGLARRPAFRWLAGATVLLAWLLALGAPRLSAPAYVGLLALMTAAYAPLNAFLDVMALDLAARGGCSFGSLRMMGSVGFILTATVLGGVVPTGNVGPTVHVAIASLAAILGLAGLALPKVAPRRPVPAASVVRQEPPLATLSPWALAALLLALVLHSASFGPYQYGFTLLGRSLQLPPLAIALGWSLGVMTEIAFFALSGLVLRRFGWRAILVCSFCVAPVRWGLLALWPSAVTYFVAQLLHGPSFALFYAAAMQALGRVAPLARAGRMQTWFCALVAGLAPGPAMYLAGQIHQHVSLPAAFGGAVGLNLVAAYFLTVALCLPAEVRQILQPKAMRSRMAGRRLACAARRYAITGVARP